jgi:hypothetical protein
MITVIEALLKCRIVFLGGIQLMSSYSKCYFYFPYMELVCMIICFYGYIPHFGSLIPAIIIRFMYPHIVIVICVSYKIIYLLFLSRAVHN